MHNNDIRGPIWVMTCLYDPAIIDNYQIRVSAIMNAEKVLGNDKHM